MRNRFLTLCLVLFSLGAMNTLKAENEKPFVIPELRHWQGSDGAFAIGASTKVLYTDAVLATAAEELARDYGLMFGKGLKTKVVKSAAQTETDINNAQIVKNIFLNIIKTPQISQ